MGLYIHRLSCSLNCFCHWASVQTTDYGFLGDLLRLDLVLEAIRVEAVEAAFGGFRLRVQEEGDRRAARTEQSDVMTRATS